MKCVIFRCSKKDEMYLYVPYKEADDTLLSELPEDLKNLTGRLEKVMELDLFPERKLARAKAVDVMASLEEKGFYIQMPPNEVIRKDDRMLDNPSDTF